MGNQRSQPRRTRGLVVVGCLLERYLPALRPLGAERVSTSNLRRTTAGSLMSTMFTPTVYSLDIMLA